MPQKRRSSRCATLPSMPKPKTPKPEYKLLPADPDADYPKAPKRCVWTPNGLELRKVEPEPEPEKD